MGATVDVFELTNQALKDLDNDKTKKGVSESVKKVSKPSRNRKFMENKRKLNKISCNKLKLESIRFAEEAEEGDFDYTPDDDVVLVIDTDMEEVPETEEDALAAAEELVGNTICKCSVCGANYVCDCENTIEEDIDGEVTLVAEEDTCPVCGEEAPQIVVGEIVANEEPDDETDTVDDTEVDDVDVDVDIDSDGEVDVDVDDDDFEESCNTKTKKTVGKPANKESAKTETAKTETAKTENTRRPLRRPMRKENRTMNRRPTQRSMRRPTSISENRRPLRRPTRVSENAMQINDKALSRLFTNFATENYSNVKSVRFTKASKTHNILTVEGIVTTIKGSRRPIKLVAENFRPVPGKFLIKMKEQGPFTEGAVRTANRVPFVIECTNRNRTINPVSMKYAFTTRNSGLKEGKGNRSSYKVYGVVR